VSKLALLGGAKVRTKPFPAHVTIGDEERVAVNGVLDSGILSNYLGSDHENFMGGVAVNNCERNWASYFNANHALAVNSNTSGLIAALGAVGVAPGDEVIVSPYSMSASATAPIFWGGIPIFADVEPEHFCLSANSIENVITEKTKAIVVVDLFGQPFDQKPIVDLARKHGIKVIEDCAQAPGAYLDGIPAGMLGDVGVFSLNYHKHIHCGEGGIVVTDDAEIAERIALIRNHAESVVGSRGIRNLENMIGFNFRMTEIEAAIANCQLQKLDNLLEQRRRNVAYFEEKISGFEPITSPKVRSGAVHAYYTHACLWDQTVSLNRDSFVSAIRAELPHFELREKEGVKIGGGYVRPIYMLPAFQQRIAIGSRGFPLAESKQSYRQGLCPVTEELHFKTLLTHEFIVPSMQLSDIDDVVLAFEKVWDNRHEIEKL
jgi:dTDP-4-amino-4,6-dideoxygalactose transaminase